MNVRECKACLNMRPESKMHKQGRGWVCNDQAGCSKRRAIRARADLRDGSYAAQEALERAAERESRRQELIRRERVRRSFNWD